MNTIPIINALIIFTVWVCALFITAAAVTGNMTWHP